MAKKISLKADKKNRKKPKKTVLGKSDAIKSGKNALKQKRNKQKAKTEAKLNVEATAKNTKQIKLPLKVMDTSAKAKGAYAKTDATGWSLIMKSLTNSEMNSQSSNVDGSNAVELLSTTARNQLGVASIFLSIAIGISILFAFVMAFLPGGLDAVPAMGGVLQEVNAPLQTAQIVFMLDMLFPIAFGAGFALLATAFQSRGNRPIVRMILTALLFVVLVDFTENSLVFKALTGGETYFVQWPLTVVKYGLLALSAMLLSSIIIVANVVGVIAQIFLRYIFPVLIALLVAGIGGRVGGDIVGAIFPLGMILLVIYASNLSK